MARSFSFKQINYQEIALFGTIDETALFDGMFKFELPRVYLDMGGIETINSTGVRLWVTFIGNYQGSIVYKNCSVPVIEQFNMVPEFMGERSEIQDFYGRFYCDPCDQEDNVLFVPGKNFDLLSRSLHSQPRCSSCQAVLDADFDEDDYLLFIDQFALELSADKTVVRKLKPYNKKAQLRFDMDGFFANIKSSNDKDFKKVAIENLSAGGFFFSSDDDYEIGELIESHFYFPIDGTRFHLPVKGKISWVRDGNVFIACTQGYGVSFTNLDDNAKATIKRFLFLDE